MRIPSSLSKSWPVALLLPLSLATSAAFAEDTPEPAPPDKTAPAVTISTPAKDQALPIADFKSTTGEATDNTGVKWVKLKLFRVRDGVKSFWNGSSFGTAEAELNAIVASVGAPSTTWRYEVSTALRSKLDAGNYGIYAYAGDNAGNQGRITGRGFSLLSPPDKTAPALTIDTPTRDQALPLADFKSATGSVTDNVGVAAVKIKLFRTRSNVRQYWTGSEFSTAETELSAVVAALGSPNTTWRYEVSSALRAKLDIGNYGIYAYALDKAGNKTSLVGRGFSLTGTPKPSDKTAPVVTISTPTRDQALPIADFKSATGEATDNTGVTAVKIKLFRTRSNVRQYWNGTEFTTTETTLTVTLASPGAPSTTWRYEVSAALRSKLDAGNYGIYATATDQAGNTSSIVGRGFSLTDSTSRDTTAPVVTLTSPSDGQSLSTTDFTAVMGGATDNVGVTTVKIKLGRTRDGVAKFWNGTEFTTTDTLLNAVVTSSGSTNASWRYEVSSALRSQLDAGAYGVYAYAYDATGNASIPVGHSFTLTVETGDTTTPVVAITAPTADQSLSITDFSAITGTATDNVGVTSVKIKLGRTRDGVAKFWNGTEFTTADTLLNAVVVSSGATNITWRYEVSSALRAKLDAGAYGVYAYAYDAAGNASVPVGRSFTLTSSTTTSDTTVPVVAITSPSDGQSLYTTNFTAILGGATDNVGVTAVKIKLGRSRDGVTKFWNGTEFTTTDTLLNAVVVSPGSTSTNWRYEISSALRAKLDAGSYGVYAYAYDAAGNSSIPVGRGFTLTMSSAVSSSATLF